MWTCSSSVNILKEGPDDYNSIISAGEKYKDPKFNGLKTIFTWNGSNIMAYYAALFELWMFGGSFERLGEHYPDSTLFGTNS